MSPFPVRASSWLVLGLLLVGSPLRPALAADDFQRYLGAAVQLYENLEYERALAQVQRARTVARGVEQDVSLGLHEGIFLAELGRWNEARTSFETALLLEPAAKLPLSVSPKVENQFESVRQDVNAAIARRMQGANPGSVAPALTTATTDAKPAGAKPESASPVATVKTPEQQPVAAAKTPEQQPMIDAKPPEQKPMADVKPPEQKPAATAKTPEQKPVAISEAGSEQKPETVAKAPEQKPVAASDRPEQVRPGRLTPSERSPGLTPKMHKKPSRTPVVPLVLLGTSMVTGSLGTFMALKSSSSGFSTREDQATANLLFGTAGATLVVAAVSWAVMQADAPPKPAKPVAEPADP